MCVILIYTIIEAHSSSTTLITLIYNCSAALSAEGGSVACRAQKKTPPNVSAVWLRQKEAVLSANSKLL